MTVDHNQEPEGRRPVVNGDPRARLAENWASVTASMVSPGAVAQPRPKQPRLQPPPESTATQRPAEPAAPPEAREIAGAGRIRESGNSLTVAVAFTIFALVVAVAMTFTTQYGANPTGDDGSGTLLAASAAIALAWTISFGHRLLGRLWGAWYMLPLALLLTGPSLSGMLWQHNQEALARSYLSATGQSTLIDADADIVASTTIYAPTGCFSFMRDRHTELTTVMIASPSPQTARQQAETALAPRFAARVAAGGAASTGRIFFFDRGQGPPRVETPEQPPLDCGIGGG